MGRILQTLGGRIDETIMNGRKIPVEQITDTRSTFPQASIPSDQIEEISADKFETGTISSKRLTFGIFEDGGGDSFIAGGKTDFTNTETGWILGIDDSDSNTPKFYIGNTTAFLNWTGSALNVAGTITASNIHIPDQDATANSFHTNSTGNSWWGATETNFNADNDNATAYVLSTGVAKFQSVTLSGSVAISGIANSTATDIALLEKSHNLTFSVTDANTIAWSAGTIVLSNGRTFSISGGNTGNMSALTYIYLDPAVSATVLQTTTTYSTAMGANKSLLGMAKNNTVTASFIPYGAGQPLIDGEDIGALSIVAGNIAASTITAGKMSVSQLSAITADLGSITAGTIVLPTGGFIRAGQTAYNTGSGWYIGNDGGTSKISMGDGTVAKSITWDGTDLLVGGNNVAVVGAIKEQVRIFSGTAYEVIGAGDDDYIWLFEDNAFPTEIFRLQINEGKIFEDSGNTTSRDWLTVTTANSGFNNQMTGATSLGIYIYVWGPTASGTWTLVRITKSDGTMATMSFSGGSPTNAANILTSDGTNLYIAEQGSTTLKKYTVSGTTATFVSNITMPDDLYEIGCDGTFFYFYSRAAATLANNLYKTNLSGTSQGIVYIDDDGGGQSPFRFYFTQNSVFQALKKMGASDEQIIPFSFSP